MKDLIGTPTVVENTKEDKAISMAAIIDLLFQATKPKDHVLSAIFETVAVFRLLICADQDE